MTAERPEAEHPETAHPEASHCESCGRPETDLVKVQRVYLLPPTEDPELSADSLPATATGESELVPAPGDIEFWCASCCGTFPHTVLSTD